MSPIDYLLFSINPISTSQFTVNFTLLTPIQLTAAVKLNNTNSLLMVNGVNFCTLALTTVFNQHDVSNTAQEVASCTAGFAVFKM